MMSRFRNRTRGRVIGPLAMAAVPLLMAQGCPPPAQNSVPVAHAGADQSADDRPTVGDTDVQDEAGPGGSGGGPLDVPHDDVSAPTTDHTMDTPGSPDAPGSQNELDEVPMDRSILAAGCDLLEGEYWEGADEYGCVFASGRDLICDDDGACRAGYVMSLELMIDRLGILEHFPAQERVLAHVNNGGRPFPGIDDEPGEVIEVCDQYLPPCESPGNVLVAIGTNSCGEAILECQCASGLIQIGEWSDGDPMCNIDTGGGGGGQDPDPPTPPDPAPPPPPNPTPTCTEQELLRALERAEQDYNQCISGAVDSLGRNLTVLVVGVGAAVLTAGTSAGVSTVIAVGDAVGGGLVLGDYNSNVDSCEYTFCKGVRRALEDCNIPVPSDPPGTLCDDHW